MRHKSKDLIAAVHEEQLPWGEARVFQSLAEQFEQADDEVRRIVAQIDPSNGHRLTTAKLRRLVLLQEIAVVIGVSPKVFD